MPRLTQAEYQAWLARNAGRGGRLVMEQPHVAEAKLHDQISDECQRRGWIAIHGRMDRRSTITIGAPDFIILADNGRTLFVEVKTATGKLKPEQMAFHAWANKLGHTVYVVRSLEDFVKVLAAGD